MQFVADADEKTLGDVWISGVSPDTVKIRKGEIDFCIIKRANFVAGNTGELGHQGRLSSVEGD